MSSQSLNTKLTHWQRVYILALSLIFILSCFKYFMMTQMIKQQEDAASIINLSGRQRMLSQRIALFSSEYFNAVNKQAQTQSARALEDTVEEFANNHHALIYGNSKLNIPPLSNQKIKEIYFADPARLDDRVKEYIETARALISENSQQIDFILSESVRPLLRDLDRVVREHEKAAMMQTQKTLTMQKIFLCLTAIVLLLEALFLFRPLNLRIKNYIRSLEDHRAIIEQQNEELKNFTFITSHNLREPLRKVSVFSQKLSKKLQENKDKDIHTYLNFILMGARQMRDQIESLKAYAEIMSASPDHIKQTPSTAALEDALEAKKKQIYRSPGCHKI